jgi:hypothetical protein
MFFITQRAIKQSDKIKHAVEHFQIMNSYLLRMDQIHKEKMQDKIKNDQAAINFSTLSQSNFTPLKI